MRVRLQVRHMWEAVRYGNVNYYEDRQALDALYDLQKMLRDSQAEYKQKT